MSLPQLPDQPRAFLCTKCGGHTCEGDIKQKHPVCAKCGYLGFADDVGYTADQMRDYGQQCREAALKEAAETARNCLNDRIFTAEMAGYAGSFLSAAARAIKEPK